MFAVGLIAFISTSLSSPTAFADNISIVTVRASGLGQDEVKATDNALSKAVGQVNGVYVKSVLTTSDKIDESFSGSGSTSQYRGTSIDKIESRTKGAVKSYTIVSMGRDGSSGLTRAVLDVQVPVLRRSDQLSRMHVAVVPGKGSDSGLTAPAQAAVEEFLVGTRKFAVLDRRQNEASEREFARIRDGLAPIEDMARVGVAPAADFLVLVTLNPSSGAAEQLAGSIALLDYATGQVRYSRSTRLALLGSARADPGSGARRLGMMLASQMVDYGFPASVIGFAGGELTIDAGESRFGVGDAVEVYRVGDRLRDPDTREKRGQLETLVGAGKIVRSAPMVSVVVLDSGNAGSAAIGSLVRRAGIAAKQDAVGKDIDDFLGGGK